VGSILAHNSDVQCGWALPFYVLKDGTVKKSEVTDRGLYLVCEVRDDLSVVDRVREEIKNGNIRSFSIAGTAKDKILKTKNGRVYYEINDLDLAEVSLCEIPVNPEAHFMILKSKVLLKDVASTFNKPLRLSDYTVALVGGIPQKGFSEHDIDLLIKAPKDSWLGRAVRLRLSRTSGVPSDMLSFIFEESGPHSDFVPLYSLWLVPCGSEVEMKGKVEPRVVDF
jgi:HK97 family phage prohead protease